MLSVNKSRHNCEKHVERLHKGENELPVSKCVECVCSKYVQSGDTIDFGPSGLHALSRN